jgi:hypothetical protein
MTRRMRQHNAHIVPEIVAPHGAAPRPQWEKGSSSNIPLLLRAGRRHPACWNRTHGSPRVVRGPEQSVRRGASDRPQSLDSPPPPPGFAAVPLAVRASGSLRPGAGSRKQAPGGCVRARSRGILLPKLAVGCGRLGPLRWATQASCEGRRAGPAWRRGARSPSGGRPFSGPCRALVFRWRNPGQASAA